MVMMVMDKLARARTSKRHRVRVRRSVRVEPMKSIEGSANLKHRVVFSRDAFFANFSVAPFFRSAP